MRKLSLHTKQKSKAQAMVEFALALPILLLLLYGMMETGRLLFIYATTVTAARQAVRYGSATGIGPGGVPYYQDCNGIQAAARKLQFIHRFQTVTIAYDAGVDDVNKDGKITANESVPLSPPNPACGSFSSANNGDRIKVTVTSQWEPIVPLVPFRPFTITSSSERTILVSVDIAVTGLPPDFGGTGGTGQLTVAASPETYNSFDESINLTYVITNIGGKDLNGPFSITDPSGKVTLTCPSSPTKLAVKATFTCTAVYHITQPDLDTGSVTLSAVSTPSGVYSSASVTLTAIQNGQLLLTKTPSKLATTTSLSYTYTLKNTGNVTLSTYAITDDKLGSICSGATLARGNTITCTMPHTVTPAEITAGSIENTATATASYNSAALGQPLTITSNIATATVITTPIALLVAGELIRGTSPYTSEQIKYTFSVTNNSDNALTLTAVNIGTFSGLGTKPTLTCGVPISIAAGATRTCDIIYYNVVLNDLNHIDSTTGAGIPITIQASATAGIYSSTTRLYPVDVYRYPALTLTATTTYNSISPAVITVLGIGDSNYTYTITNTGNVTLSPPLGGFAVTDTEITRDITCATPTASIAPGGTKICTSTREILQADLDNGSVLGTAETAAMFGITSYPAIAKSLTITSTVPRLKLEITTPFSSVIGAGVNINYSYVLTNIGNTGLTTVADGTDYDFTTGYKGNYPICTVTTLNIGESTTCTGTYKTQKSDLGIDVVNTTSAIAYTLPTSTPANQKVTSNSASVSVAVVTPNFCSVQHGTLQISPVFGMTLVNNNDFEIEIDSVQITFNDKPPSQQIYELALEGNQFWADTSVQMNGYHEFLPKDFTGIYVIPGNTTYLLSVADWKMSYTPASPSIEKIVVSFTNPNCQDLDSGVVIVPPSADMTITKTGPSGDIDIGSLVSYTIHVVNNGPSSMSGSKLSDPAASGLLKTAVKCSSSPGICTAPPTVSQLESGSFTLPTLTNGQSYEIVVTAKVTAVTPNTIVTNTATVAVPAGSTDPKPGDNVSSVSNKVVTPSADFAVTKSNGGAINLLSGSSTTYTITVTNNGNSTISNAKLQDAAAAGLTKTAVSCSGTPGKCAIAPSITQLEAGAYLPTLAKSDTYQITVTATVTATSNTPPLSNTAIVSLPVGASDPNMSNNTATDNNDTIALPSADLAVTKTDGVTTVVSGSDTTYTIRVTNGGPDAITGAILKDLAATGLSKKAVACSISTPGKCDTPPTVTQLEAGFALPTLALNEYYEIIVTANVTAASGSVKNVATVTAPANATETNASNNTTDPNDTDTVTSAPDFSITKTDGITSVLSGANTTYTIRITNVGSSNAANVDLTDAVVTGLDLTSLACSTATSNLCTSGNLPTTTTIKTGANIGAIASGKFYELLATYHVTAQSGSVMNTAVASASGKKSANATDLDTVTRTTNLAVTKSNGVNGVAIGSSTTYILTVTNNGNSSVTGAVLTDPLGTGLSKTGVTVTCGAGCTTPPTSTQLQAGYALPAIAISGTYTINVTANVTATSGNVSNTATVAPPVGVAETNSSDNSATDTDPLLSADLSITKSDGSILYSQGGTVIYTVTVKNLSGVPVTGATVSDAKPALLTDWTWTCSSQTGGAANCTPMAKGTSDFSDTVDLPVGGIITYSVSATVAANASGILENTAFVAVPSGYIDSVSSNNSSKDSDSPACVGTSKSGNLTTTLALVSAGQVTMTITNNLGVPLPIGTLTTSWSGPAGNRINGITYDNPGTTLITGINSVSPYTFTGTGAQVLNTGKTTFTFTFSKNGTVSFKTILKFQSPYPTSCDRTITTTTLTP